MCENGRSEAEKKSDVCLFLFSAFPEGSSKISLLSAFLKIVAVCVCLADITHFSCILAVLEDIYLAKPQLYITSQLSFPKVIKGSCSVSSSSAVIQSEVDLIDPLAGYLSECKQ